MLPATSRWNNIEGRHFSAHHPALAWSPLQDHAVIVNLTGNTTGLEVHCGVEPMVRPACPLPTPNWWASSAKDASSTERGTASSAPIRRPDWLCRDS